MTGLLIVIGALAVLVWIGARLKRKATLPPIELTPREKLRLVQSGGFRLEDGVIRPRPGGKR